MPVLALHVSRHRGDVSEMFNLLDISSSKSERATHSTQCHRPEMGESGSLHNDLPGTLLHCRRRLILKVSGDRDVGTKDGGVCNTAHEVDVCAS